MNKSGTRTRFISWPYRIAYLGLIIVPILLCFIVGSVIMRKQADSYALHFLAGSNRDIKNVARSKFDLIQFYQFKEESDLESQLTSMAKLIALTCRQIELMATRNHMGKRKAQDFAVQFVESINILDTGYAFILLNGGSFLSHPKLPKGFDPENVRFIREILTEKQGVVRYWWRNPEESEPVERLTGFEPVPSWDWIIGVSVPMKDVLDLPFKEQNMEGAKEYIRNFQPGHDAHAFVLNANGDVVAHPMYAEGESSEIPGHDEIMNRKKQFINYRDHMNRQFYAYVDRFQPFEWTIVVTAPYESLYRELAKIQPVWIAGCVLFFVFGITLLSIINRGLVARVIALRRPIKSRPTIFESDEQPPKSLK